jgi:hypothetical protein
MDSILAQSDVALAVFGPTANNSNESHHSTSDTLITNLILLQRKVKQARIRIESKNTFVEFLL